MIYIFFADGFEEVEGIATLDIIRRAGIDIKSVGVGSKTVTGSHGLSVNCDIAESEVSFSEINGVILPGGMPGTNNLYSDSFVLKTVNFCSENNYLIAAICAAPIILGRLGLLDGKKAVCFPGFENELSGAEISSDFVVTDGNIITGKGMGSAVNFGISIVSFFKSNEFSNKLKSTLQCS